MLPLSLSSSYCCLASKVLIYSPSRRSLAEIMLSLDGDALVSSCVPSPEPIPLIMFCSDTSACEEGFWAGANLDCSKTSNMSYYIPSIFCSSGDTMGFSFLESLDIFCSRTISNIYYSFLTALPISYEPLTESGEIMPIILFDMSYSGSA